MMNGVEILAQNTIYETEYNYWYLLIFTGIGLLIGLIIAIVCWFRYGFDADYFMPIALTTMLGVTIGLNVTVSFEYETDTVDYIEYKVTVSENVNFTEFIDKYEIIDQECKIYTVRERE